MEKFIPYPHQEEAKEFINSRDRSVLFLPTGSGKTLTALYALKEYGENKIIFVTIPSLFGSGQLDRESEKIGYRPYTLNHSIKKRNLDTLVRWFEDKNPSVLFVSWQRLRNISPSVIEILNRRDNQGRLRSFSIVYDECSYAKNNKTLNYKTARAMSTLVNINKVIAMSASVKNLFTQNHILESIGINIMDDNYIWSNFTLYRLQKVSRYKNVRNIIGFKNINLFNQMTQPYIFAKSKSEISKNIPPFRIIHHIIAQENQKIKKMQEEALNYYKSKTPVTATVPLLFPLFIETSVKNNDPDSPIITGYHKEVLSILETDPNTTFIIYCRLSEEVRILTKILVSKGIDAIDVYSKAPNVSQRIEDFKNSKYRVVVATSAISHGIDGLQKVCSDIIFFSPPDDFEVFQQFSGRLSRFGGKNADYVNINLLYRPKSIIYSLWMIVASNCSLVRKINPEVIDEGLNIDHEFGLNEVSDVWSKSKIEQSYRGLKPDSSL